MISLSALLFIVFFAVGCLATLFLNPFFGILLYEIEYFLNPPIRWWFREVPHIRYSFVTSIVIVTGFLLQYKKFSANRLFSVMSFRWLAAMAITICVTYAWAVDTDLHVRWMNSFLTFALFAVFLYKMTDEAWKLELVLKAYLLGIFYICWVGWQLGRTGDGRLEGIGGPDCMEVNGIAAVLTTAVPLLMFYLLYAEKKWLKFAALVFLVFVLNGLVLFNSRGAFVATLFSGLYFAYYVVKENRTSAARYKVIAGIAVALLLFIYLADAEFWMRMQTLQNLDADEGSGGRFRLWMKTFEMLADYPMGLGAMGYRVLSPLYLPVEWLSRGQVHAQRVVHSVWFEVLSEYGFHGLFIFLGYVLSNFVLLKKVRVFLREKNDLYHLQQSLALQASFLAFLIASSFINRLYSEMMYWLPAIIASFANIHYFRPGSGLPGTPEDGSRYVRTAHDHNSK